MSQEEPNGTLEFGSEPKAHAYTDGASGGSRGPGGYGAVLRWKGKTQEISGGEQNATNQRLELTAACVALKHGRGASRDGQLRLVLPHQLHEEGLVQEVAGERLAQPPWRASGKQGLVGEAVGSVEAPPGSAVEEGQGALENRRPAQEWKRPCRRAGGSRKERGQWRTKNSTSRSGKLRRAEETRRQ